MSSIEKVNDAPESVTVTISREDLRLIRSALEEFLASFSHDQGDLLDQIKSLLVRLPDGDRKPAGQSSLFQRLTL